jgi:uncharacterized protein
VAEGVLVGRVAAVLRYPVKSMAAEPVEDVDVSWHGLSGDRRWAFVRPDLPSNGFPWLTLRQRNDLNDYHPCWTEPERPDASAVIVLPRQVPDSMSLRRLSRPSSAKAYG